MYYRRKILLSLLQSFDGELDKMSLQKLLFLLSRQQADKSFHFVPYKFGCFSFQANADLGTLVKYGLVAETDKTWKKSDNINYIKELKIKDQAILRYVKNQFGAFSQEELVKLTYRNYPYYAINSTIVANVLCADELDRVEKQKLSKPDIVLFTIGYEGVSLEEYLNKLIINDVRVLCDVRKNSLSMKYGFSKSQLQKACTGVGLEYIHIPEVGIDSDKRQSLNTQADYNKLFISYRAGILKNETAKQLEILTLLKNKRRIALTCFEANIFQCHRKHLAESIAKMGDFEYELKHI
ncbi:MAG: DUF488 domain-containing protein [Bacteroidetes bacterium]|nr:DUF488 domain-containing protein [Bacteroidota bacterium]MBU1719742.1 DUF488 domain-containing protein [Bacteroidota bacterium]